MNTVIKGLTIAEGWQKSILHLIENKKEDYNLIVEIENPIRDDIEVRTAFNKVLNSMNDQSVETVANTIFPLGLYKTSENTNAFYQRFLNVYPTLRRIRDNNKGTYFGRLVAWSYGQERVFNQIKQTIYKLKRERENGRGIRVMYEMSIYDPNLDNNNQMGFPCMSFISVKVRNQYVDLTAVYRNQKFVQKAYGNFLGLGRLLEFIAEESGYEIGKLTCIATHAYLGEITPKANYLKMVDISSGHQQTEFNIDG